MNDWNNWAGASQSWRLIPDEAAEISARLATLADGGQVAAIFTTGGTGVAPRDVTPEATRAVLDREIPGFGELMRAARARIHAAGRAFPRRSPEPAGRC